MAITFNGNPNRRRPPISPQTARLLSAVGTPRMGRRDFLRASAFAGGGALLAACGIPAQSARDAASPGTTPRAGGVVNFANWQLYIDVDDTEETRPTLDRFTEETGIRVNYYEDINSNEEYFGMMRGLLDAGQSLERDIVVLTDWMASRIINLEWVQELDHDHIENRRNLRESLRQVGFDPGRTYSLPWQSGMTGIGVNPAAVDIEITSVNDLFDPSLAGRVTMLSEMRDTMGLIMSAMDIDPADHRIEEYRQAIDRLQRAVDDGQIRQFTGNEYAADLAAGNIAAAMAWSGDIIQLQFDNPDLQFIVPDEGAFLWSDNMLIPTGAEHKANAEALINYYYQPDVAAELAAWVNYITPVSGAQEAMEDIDPELVDDELIFPTDELLNNTWEFTTLIYEAEVRYQSAFQDVIGA